MKKQVKKVAEKALSGGIYERAVLPKHYGVAVAANVKRKFPGKGLTVIGVTGTNGKTSTCYLIHKMLIESGQKAGLMTTVSYGVGDDIQPQMAHMTTQSVQIVLERIIKMKEQGMEVLVLEVTSQALAQFRIMGVPIDIAVMTNITHEHLDYHGTFQRYVAAKLKLFRLAARNKNGRQIGILNSDDDSAVLFADAVPNAVAFSMNEKSPKGVAHPENLKLTPSGSSYTMKVAGDSYKIKCQLPGSFNVANSMAAALVGRSLGLSKTQIEKGIAALNGVEGRMTNIDEGQNFDVIIDFAHTPDSFEKLFADIRPMAKGKIISLFGSAGRRDELKRATQGEIAGKYSDIVILTEEDDRDVDGHKILDQIASGVEKSGKTRGKDLFLVLDRTKAIKQALKTAKKGDTVILLGKGHEKTIERADGEHKWDEIGLTRKLLNKL